MKQVVLLTVAILCVGRVCRALGCARKVNRTDVSKRWRAKELFAQKTGARSEVNAHQVALRVMLCMHSSIYG